MLLLDSTNLSVYEVADESLCHWANSPPSISFERFETTARSHFCSIFLAAQFPTFRVGAETLVFVRLAHGRGWAWASRVRVAVRNELPIPESLIGEEFLFLWPVPMAINAHLNFKEKARLSNGNNAYLTAFVSAIEAHPPSMAFVPQHLKGHAIETVREVRAKDLTVPQRLFVASLTPHTTAFASRSPCDKWTDSLHTEDERDLHRFLRADPSGGDVDALSAGPALRTRARRQHRRRTLDLPDDAVERIVAICVSRSMQRTEEMQLAVSRLRLVNAQFCRATDSALRHMLGAVTIAAQSLLGPSPREPGDVQAVVSAAGLTLRHAIALQPARWRVYIRARQEIEKRDDRVPGVAQCLPACTRWQLLWDARVYG
jgi:hypothetical protein